MVLPGRIETIVGRLEKDAMLRAEGQGYRSAGRWRAGRACVGAVVHEDLAKMIGDIEPISRTVDRDGRADGAANRQLCV
jgi:hypothetical protein